MSSKFQHHLIFTSAPSMGHVRSSIPVIFRIVKERPDILVTVTVVGSFKASADREFARYCTGPNSALRDNIRVIQVSSFEGSEFERWGKMMKAWPVLFAKLWACEPVVCCTGRTYPSVPKPSLCVLDVGLGYPLGTRIADEKKIKLLIWVSLGISSTLSMFGPSQLGGLSDTLIRDAPALAKSKNISIEEARLELFYSPTEKVRKIAGIPPAYHYEFEDEHGIPGATEFLLNFAGKIYRLTQSCDGALLGNTPIFEEEAHKAFEKWFTDMGKTSYAVGPCIIPDLVTLNHEETPKDREVIDFLDKICEKRGERSLIFMSFGTSSFPSGKTPWQLISIMLELEIPLIFAMAHGNSYETDLPDDIRARMESSDLALVSKWVPQPTILNHRVTGAFLTHAGLGGLTETVLAGIVPIIWPLQADQPANCMNCVLNLKIAYQLLEVRTGKGLLPLYRGYQPTGTEEAIDREFRQVLKDVFGTDGEVKRKKIQELRKSMIETCKENGYASNELRRMLREHFP